MTPKYIEPHDHPDHPVILLEIENANKEIMKLAGRFDRFEAGLRDVQDWRLQFVAKFTAYSTIALFLGTIFAQLAVDLLKRGI